MSRSTAEADEIARVQIIYEMARRDVAAERREAAEERRRQRWTARKFERAEAIDRAWLEAEAATKGNMLNRRGQESGISERSLFTGPESRARKYASEELLNHWQTHPRPTEAYFQGQDTTLGPQYTAPRRRQSFRYRMWRP